MVFIALPNNEVSELALYIRPIPPNHVWARCSHFSATQHHFSQDYLGSAPELQIAQHISACHGPSGSNSEYALKLSVALERLGVPDVHVSAIARHLMSMGHSL
jgi:cation transport regulator ChaC